MAADVSSFVYFAPVLVFLVVFAIMVALLHKTKLLGENMYLQIFFSFVIATIFITASSVKQLVLNVIPWFAVLLIALFLIMALLGFMGKTDIGKSRGLSWVFIILLILVFLVFMRLKVSFQARAGRCWCMIPVSWDVRRSSAKKEPTAAGTCAAIRTNIPGAI